MKERFKAILSLEKISPAQLAALLGVQRSTLSNILGGRNNPSYEILKSILTKLPNLNFEWLLSGEGLPYKDIQKNLRGEQIAGQNFNGQAESSAKKQLPAEQSSGGAQLQTESPDQSDALFTDNLFAADGDYPADEPSQEYHPFPAVEEGELLQRAERLQQSVKQQIKPQNPSSELSENPIKAAKTGIAREIKEPYGAKKELDKVILLFKDGTFQEYKR